MEPEKHGLVARVATNQNTLKMRLSGFPRPTTDREKGRGIECRGLEK
jgi:hypothetical protein